MCTVTSVKAGSVIAGVAFHVPDPKKYWRKAAEDLSSNPNSKLKALGVYSFSAPGVRVKLDLPAPPVPPPPPVPYTGIPLKTVDSVTDVVAYVSMGGIAMGIGMAVFCEVAASYSGAARISSLSLPEGEPMNGNSWHTGAAVFSGGAFRTFITQVQFIAAISSLGGRGGQPHVEFTYPEPVNRGVGNFSFHNRSLIADVRLPIGVRSLAEKLDWSNLRSNVTWIFPNDADLFPRPCDVYAQQVTIGTCLVVLFIQLFVYCLRTLIHKFVERSTLLKYGAPTTAGALTFPKWESLVITNTYYGVTQVVGICIGSLCRDWVIGGIFLGLFPLASCFLVLYFTFQAVHVYKVVKFCPHQVEVSDDNPQSSKRYRQVRTKGKWKRTIQITDSNCTFQIRFLMLFSAAFNDMGAGLRIYYLPFSMFLRMICGVASGAAHNWLLSASIFVVMYIIDLIVTAVAYPYIDVQRNRMEVRTCVSVRVVWLLFASCAY